MNVNGNFELMLFRGVLTGAYTNNHTEGIWFPECAIRQDRQPATRFEGEYDSAWIESPSAPKQSALHIHLSGNVYVVTWIRNGVVVFRSTDATVHGNILRGSYQSV